MPVPRVTHFLFVPMSRSSVLAASRRLSVVLSLLVIILSSLLSSSGSLGPVGTYRGASITNRLTSWLLCSEFGD
jgi:hypothetical protein